MKPKSIYRDTYTTFTAGKTHKIEVPLIGDILGFDVWYHNTSTFAAGANALRDYFNSIKLITDDSEVMYEMKNFQDDAITAALAMLNRINSPTNESPATTVAGYLHYFLPFSVIRALVQNATLEIDMKAANAVDANITATSQILRVSVRYGAVERMVRITGTQKSETGPNYAVQLPPDKGNLTGIMLLSTDADLVHYDTVIRLLDESGLPVVDDMRAADIVAENEQMLGYGWKGLSNAVYALYIDFPMVACKPDIRLEINCNGALTNGLCVYWLTDYAEQMLIRPFAVSEKIFEIGSYGPSDVEIRKYQRLEEQMRRINSPLVASADSGAKLAEIEKTIQK